MIADKMSESDKVGLTCSQPTVDGLQRRDNRIYENRCYLKSTVMPCKSYTKSEVFILPLLDICLEKMQTKQAQQTTNTTSHRVNLPEHLLFYYELTFNSSFIVVVIIQIAIADRR